MNRRDCAGSFLKLHRVDSRLRCVVLGANGFLGRAVVRQLLRLGHDVVKVSRSPLKASAQSSDTGTCTSLIADVAEPNALRSALEEADVVFHLATSTHPTLYLDDPIAEMQNSLVPLQNILDQVIEAGVKKLVFPSSGGTVYVEQDSPRTESTGTDPKTPYAIFKLASEFLLKSTAERTGSFSVDVMRIANLYGPDQPKRPGQGVLPHWLDALKSGLPLTIFGDGSSSRDYVHVEDAAHCLVSSCDRLEHSGVYNVGTGVAVTLNELVATLSEILDRKLDVQHLAARSSDLQSVCLDSTKLMRQLPGFSWIPLKKGLHTCIPTKQSTEKEILQ